MEVVIAEAIIALQQASSKPEINGKVLSRESACHYYCCYVRTYILVYGPVHVLFITLCSLSPIPIDDTDKIQIVFIKDDHLESTTAKS